MKFINAYTHTEKKNQEEFIKRKFQFNETNFGSEFLVKYIYICIKFLMYEIYCDS